MIDILISQFPGFLMGFMFFCALSVCRDAGDFDALKAWWREVRDAFSTRHEPGRFD